MANFEERRFTKMTTLQKPVSNTNINIFSYLPLMFTLQEDIVERCPIMRELPRNPNELVNNPEIRKIVETDRFMLEVMDAFSYVVFPHLGFRGWKEDYSGECPVWIISYLFDAWLDGLKELFGIDEISIFHIFETKEIPFPSPEFSYYMMKNIVQWAIEKYNLQPILDTVREMPCEEDFEFRNSHVKIDFIRKWYHSRSKIGFMSSLQVVMKRGDWDYHSKIPAVLNSMADFVISEDYCQRFKERLSEKDRKILEMREVGFTFEEIADKLEYKNHSGVVKRMQAIKDAFLKYDNEQQ